MKRQNRYQILIKMLYSSKDDAPQKEKINKDNEIPSLSNEEKSASSILMIRDCQAFEPLIRR